MRGLTHWCLRHRWLVITGWLALALLTSVSAQLAGHRWVDSFSLPHTESHQAAALLASASPQVAGDTELVVVEAPPGRLLIDPPTRRRVQALLDEVASVPHVTRIVSPYDSGARQVAQDGRIGFASVTFDQPFENISKATAKRLVDTVRSANDPMMRAAVTGQVAEAAITPAPTGVGVGVAVAAVVLLLVFGSLIATLLPLVCAVVSLGAALGIVELLTHVASMASTTVDVMLLVGLGVGIDYALFIVTRHREGLRAGLNTDTSILTAVRTSGRAVMFAGTVVCIAALGMFTLGVNFFYGWAIGVMVGVALTMFAALTLLPALLSLLGTRVLPRRQRGSSAPRTAPGGFWQRWTTALTRRPAVVAAASLGLIALIAVPGLSLRLGSADQGTDPPGTTTRPGLRHADPRLRARVRRPA